MENPAITADVIEAVEFPELAQRYGVYGVPKTVINEVEAIEGAVPEDQLLQRVLAVVGVPPDGNGDGAGPSDPDGV